LETCFLMAVTTTPIVTGSGVQETP
jgi:hypothetical protein